MAGSGSGGLEGPGPPGRPAHRQDLGALASSLDFYLADLPSWGPAFMGGFAVDVLEVYETSEAVGGNAWGVTAGPASGAMVTGHTAGLEWVGHHSPRKGPSRLIKLAVVFLSLRPSINYSYFAVLQPRAIVLGPGWDEKF